MEAYAKETEKPYGYLLIDNQPKTTSDKQVVADVKRQSFLQLLELKCVAVEEKQLYLRGGSRPKIEPCLNMLECFALACFFAGFDCFRFFLTGC